jgi:diadenosine tetraphosphatase ApaH/serine/threonine PP2A family protein phosphatase
MLAHGSPLNEDQYIQKMRDAWAPLQQMATAIAFVGHTHIQGGFAQKEHDWQEVRPRYAGRAGSEMWTLAIAPGVRYLINPGAVGQPRDFDWRAAFAIYDSEACEVADTTACRNFTTMATIGAKTWRRQRNEQR